MIYRMKRFGVVITIITLVILGGGVYLFSKGSSSQTVPPVSGYEYYWGTGCPHCAKVDEFFQTWALKDKVEIAKREVWYNKTNAKIFAARLDACQIPQQERGVPVLVTPEGKCLSGDELIINHLKEIRINEEST